jgi:hypothetical protein
MYGTDFCVFRKNFLRPLSIEQKLLFIGSLRATRLSGIFAGTVSKLKYDYEQIHYNLHYLLIRATVIIM